MERRFWGPAAGALAFESAALFAYGQLHRRVGTQLVPKPPPCEQTLESTEL